MRKRRRNTKRDRAEEIKMDGDRDADARRAGEKKSWSEGHQRG